MIPRIQLPDASPDRSRANSLIVTSDVESRPGYFVSKDGAIGGHGHDDTQVELAIEVMVLESSCC